MQTITQYPQTLIAAFEKAFTPFPSDEGEDSRRQWYEALGAFALGWKAGRDVSQKEGDTIRETLEQQNKLLRAECKAAQEMDTALLEYLKNSQDGFTSRAYKKYITQFNLWQTAHNARVATEPPF